MVSAQDWLDLVPGIGLRADSFEFELVTETRATLGDVEVSADTIPNVQVDSTRTSVRLVNNLEILASDLSQIDLFHDRLRVWMITPDGFRWPCGVFMFGELNAMPHTWGNRYTPQLFDEAFLVNQPLSHTYNVPRGGSVLDMFRRMVNEIELPDISLDVPDLTAASPLVYQVGSLRYDALKALAQILGCFPPYFSNAGTFTLRLVPPRGSVAFDHLYDIDTRIIDDTTTITADAYIAPNRWIVISGATVPIVGLYDLPSTSPASAAVTGRIVTAEPVSVQGLADVAQANIAARNAAVTDPTVYDKASFQSTADPRHDVFDTVLLANERYVETAWQIECSSGGVMSHSLSKLYD